jgi:hypothetical protein
MLLPFYTVLRRKYRDKMRRNAKECELLRKSKNVMGQLRVVWLFAAAKHAFLSMATSFLLFAAWSFVGELSVANLRQRMF